MIVNTPPISKSPSESPYDYIVVGSGAGGAPLAARLAERGASVLVLEAGPNHFDPAAPSGLVTSVPALHAPSSEDPHVSWQFFVDHYTNPSEPDPKWCVKERGIFYPRATGIGGCTVHNAMITVAGPAADWDELSWFLNDPSWGSDVMRAYFQTVECCQYQTARPRPRTLLGRTLDVLWWLLGRDEDPTAGRHGFNGWLRTSIADPAIGLTDGQLLKMLKAALKTSWWAGLEAPSIFVKKILQGEGLEDLDPNHFRRQSDRPEGVVLIPQAIQGPDTEPRALCGHRSSPARRLLEVANGHALTIATDCLVTKVLLERGADGACRATGVEYQHGPSLYSASATPNLAEVEPSVIHAKREVILCGGAFNTPQLLMLSGIGPRGQLQDLGVKCLVHSPGVGQNLQDRYEVTVVSQMRDRFGVLTGATFKADPADEPLKQWQKDGSGLYASNGAVLGILKRSRPDLAQPDLFIFGIPLTFKGYAPGYSVVNPSDFNLFTWAILKARTRNPRGTVTLASTNPRERPRINFNYFGHDGADDADARSDLDAMVEGVKFVRAIARNAGHVVERETHPGVDGTSGAPPVATDDEVRKWIKREAWGHHACGTCRMGRANDPMAVTDSGFRVLGAVDSESPRKPRDPVRGLRVVDASIFPKIPGFFIVTNIYMASEKAADAICPA